MNRSISYTASSPESSPDSRPRRMGLKSFKSYNVSTSLDTLQFLPATTYNPPSPRGRLVQQSAYVRPSLRLDHHMMPSPEEIMAAAAMTRGRRSSSTSSTSSIDSTSSTRSEKRQGRLFMPSSGGSVLDLLTENRDMED